MNSTSPLPVALAAGATSAGALRGGRGVGVGGGWVGVGGVCGVAVRGAAAVAAGPDVLVGSGVGLATKVGDAAAVLVAPAAPSGVAAEVGEIATVAVTWATRPGVAVACGGSTVAAGRRGAATRVLVAVARAGVAMATGVAVSGGGAWVGVLASVAGGLEASTMGAEVGRSRVEVGVGGVQSGDALEPRPPPDSIATMMPMTADSPRRMATQTQGEPPGRL